MKFELLIKVWNRLSKQSIKNSLRTGSFSDAQQNFPATETQGNFRIPLPWIHSIAFMDEESNNKENQIIKPCVTASNTLSLSSLTLALAFPLPLSFSEAVSINHFPCKQGYQLSKHNQSSIFGTLRALAYRSSTSAKDRELSENCKLSSDFLLSKKTIKWLQNAIGRVDCNL